MPAAAPPASGARSVPGRPVGSEGGRQGEAPQGCLLVVPPAGQSHTQGADLPLKCPYAHLKK